MGFSEDWALLGVGYPGEGVEARAAFDVLAPVINDRYAYRRAPAYNRSSDGFWDTPDVTEVWELAGAVAKAVVATAVKETGASTVEARAAEKRAVEESADVDAFHKLVRDGLALTPAAARGADILRRIRQTEETRNQRVYSTRGLPLVLTAARPLKVPTLTVELYVKWYMLFVVLPNGEIKEVPFPDSPDCCGSNEAAYVDDVPNPRVVRKYALLNGLELDPLAEELLVGRWGILRQCAEEEAEEDG